MRSGPPIDRIDGGLRGRPFQSVARESDALRHVLWRSYGPVVFLLAVGVTVIGLVFDDYPRDSLLSFGLLLAVVGGAAALAPMPKLGGVAHHIVVASPAIMVSVGMLAAGPGALIVMAAAIFIAPFVASNFCSRKTIALHVAFASVALIVPVAFGALDGRTSLSVALVVPIIWISAFFVVVVCEAAELQGNRLEHLTRRDPLTGAGNRRLLAEQLTYEIERHVRTHHALSVLTLDLDGFKALNDTVGHDAGDALLCSVALALQSTCRAQDTVVRQGGDEFCIVLPETTAAEARVVERSVHEALATVPSFGLPITAAIGTATFPSDARDRDGLLDVADQRLLAGKAHAHRPAPAPERGAPVLRGQPGAPVVAANELGQITRVELGATPLLWRGSRVMATMSATVVAVFAVSADGTSVAGNTLAVAMALFVAAVWCVGPPKIDSVFNHVALAVNPILVVAFAFAFPADVGALVGAASFIGTHAAVRLARRRQIVAHWACSTVALVAVMVFGSLDQTTTLMLAIVIVGIWVLGSGCVAVLEGLESQGRELAHLVRCDPLTGVGNRRLLSERLDDEIRRHTRRFRPLCVLAIDLNGFKAINDNLGHTAGDALLCEVASGMEAVVRRSDTVVRQGGDEFCVLLPETDLDAAGTVAAAIAVRLDAIKVPGYTLSAGIGIATFPGDATEGQALLQVADARLRAQKSGATVQQPVR